MTLVAAVVAAQDLPPPKKVQKPKPTPAPSAGGRGSGGASQVPIPTPTPTPEPPPTGLLLVSCDLPCSITIDGEPVGQMIEAQVPERLTASPGQHLVVASDRSGRARWEKVIDVKANAQSILQIELKPNSPDIFDATLAEVWLAIGDLMLSGRYIQEIPGRDWRSVQESDTAPLFAAQQTLDARVARLKKLNPQDEARKRIAEEVGRVSAAANRYVELQTASIDAARKKEGKGWKLWGNKSNEPTRALDKSLEWSTETWALVRDSEAFRQALPEARRIQLGLAPERPRVRTGLLFYNYRPDEVAIAEAGSISRRAGFKSGDRVTAVAGQEVGSVFDLELTLVAHQGKKVPITVERGGERKTLDLEVPAAAPPR